MVIKLTEAGLTENARTILGLLEETWQKIQPHLGSPNYTGCIVRIEQLKLPPMATTMLVGQVGQHEARLVELVAEKNTKLRERNFSAGHQTSRQSRDPYQVRFGGAIITKYGFANMSGPLIVGVAGLTEEADEAFAITIARLTGFLQRADADTLAAMSNNQLYIELLMAPR